MSIPLQPDPAPLPIKAAVAVLGKDGRPILDYAQALAMLAALEDEARNLTTRAAREAVNLWHVPFEEAPDYRHELEAGKHAVLSAARLALFYAAFTAYLKVSCGQAWAGELPDTWAPLLWQDGDAHDDE